MREFLEAALVEVLDSEYNRLLGLPPDFVRKERVEELALWARNWYAENGKPWTFSRLAKDLRILGESFEVEGVLFQGGKTLERLKEAKAHSVVLVGVGAGPETEREAQRCWELERPDEYFFLEMYGSAVVEHLLTRQSAKICEWADARDWAALPHYSPGYTGWDLQNQAALFDLILAGAPTLLRDRMELLPSGMIRPRKSQIALIGVADKGNVPLEFDRLIPCEDCAFSPCRFRRAPYKWRIYEEGAGRNGAARMADTGVVGPETLPAKPSPLHAKVRYAFSERVLERWANERLSLEADDRGSLLARFLYEGSTCNNIGFPIQMEYQIRLSSADEGYRILETRCSPAQSDEGFKRTCGYLNSSDDYSAMVQGEHPLVGESLREIPKWNPTSSPSGCWCTKPDRDHKWKVVFQTLYYKLANHDE